MTKQCGTTTTTTTTTPPTTTRRRRENEALHKSVPDVHRLLNNYKLRTVP